MGTTVAVPAPLWERTSIEAERAEHAEYVGRQFHYHIKSILYAQSPQTHTVEYHKHERWFDMFVEQVVYDKIQPWWLGAFPSKSAIIKRTFKKVFGDRGPARKTVEIDMRVVYPELDIAIPDSPHFVKVATIGDDRVY